MANPTKYIISLSFKKEEKWLFDILQTYSCPSATIKDILKQYFSKTKETNPIDSGKSDSLFDICL
ncbi:MAG: hypothetical protein RSF40_01730 [Oscillospiraceae bacterium]